LSWPPLLDVRAATTHNEGVATVRYTLDFLFCCQKMSFSYFEALPPEAKRLLSFTEVEILVQIFHSLDQTRQGSVSQEDIPELVRKVTDCFGNVSGEAFPQNSPLSFESFAKIFTTEHKRPQPKIQREVSVRGAIHSFSEEEREGYVEFINSTLKDDPDLQSILPINPRTQDIFATVSNGLILCKLINAGFPDTVQMSQLNIKASNAFEKVENHNACINAAAKLGCSVVNIGGKDLLEGTPHLVLGLMWQIIKKNLLARVAANRSKEEGLVDLPPEQVLFRWFNYHLSKAGSTKTLTNWSRDLQDSELYLILLSQLEPDKLTKDEIEVGIALSDLNKRAELVCEFAKRIGCLKFVTPKEIVSGNPRLNLAFVATLFTEYPQIGPTEEEKQMTKLQERLGSVEQSLAQVSDEKSQLTERTERLARDFEDKTKELSEVTGRLTEALQEREALSRHREKLEDFLKAEQAEKNHLAAELETYSRDKLELTSRLAEETAQREKADRELENLRTDLRETKERHEQETTNLRTQLERQLDEEREERKAAEQELDETRAELEETRAEADEEKTLLLQRIKDLEEELDQLKELMATSLTQAGREKADALRRAQEERERMLDEAEKARIAQMKKVQGMLAKVQKNGYLYKLEKSAVLGTSKWKKKYFVLQDNFLSYYKDEKAWTEARPEGIIYCEQCRVYELDQGKKQYGFQLDSGKQQHNLAALKLEDMKEWMKDIKEAKKKAVGVKIVSEDKNVPESLSPRP